MPAKNKILKRGVVFVLDGDADIFRFIIAMTSFKDARNLLLESYNDGMIDNDEFILLYEGNFSKILILLVPFQPLSYQFRFHFLFLLFSVCF